MVQKYYNVINEFNPEKDYGIKVRKQYAKCLLTFNKYPKINPDEFTEDGVTYKKDNEDDSPSGVTYKKD